MLAEPDEVKVLLPPETRRLSDRRMALQRDRREESLLQENMAGERKGGGVCVCVCVCERERESTFRLIMHMYTT